MTQTAAICTQLTTHEAHPYGLFIDGLDVIKEPGQKRYGVDIDSIQVIEAGQGAVSSLSFSIDDPSLLITIADGAYIYYHDFTRDLPIFAGWVESVAVVNDFGDQGRRIDVGCYGYEAMLDAIIVPSLTFHVADQVIGGGGVGTQADDAQFLQLVAGFGPLRQFSFVSNPSQAFPLGTGTTKLTSDIVLDGMTIRQAYEAFTSHDGVGRGATSPTRFLSVDPWGGVRLFPQDHPPSDYATITLSDTPAGTLAAEGLIWERTQGPSEIIGSVYVNGGNAAGTGWVRGNGTGRREAYVSDSTITTADGKYAAARALLERAETPSGRGSFTLSAYTPTTARPGGLVSITDARQGWTAQTFLITEIRKTFNSGGTQNWTVSFASASEAPNAGASSVSKLLRTLTRGTAQ